MILSRRRALALLSAAVARSGLALQQAPSFAVTDPFAANLASLRSYRTPAWFADAKFGIWAHWGPQSGIEQGDWYARLMYVQGSPQYHYQLATYGHPTKVGYKDLVPTFKAAQWDPDHLMDLYVRAGARYFVSMGVHHDNYDLWNSRFQPRWNSVAIGPKRDIVGEWRVAARKRGLRFGVSEHLSNSFDWFAPAHLADRTGALAGVSYDGTQPAFADLYHDYTGMPADFARTAQDMGRVAPARWKELWLHRVDDLLDQHQPDLLYTDGSIAFGDFGLNELAELYNVSAKAHDGENQAVFLGKSADECTGSLCTLDRERTVGDEIRPEPWQTDTCIGNWHYQRGIQYKTPKKIVDLLVDIVSKNGNLLLNFPLPNSGVLDPEERRILETITAWMQSNGEGIFGTRPWIVYGDGPAYMAARAKADVPVQVGAGFNEGAKPDLGPTDIRFTTKGSTLYAFAHGWPSGELTIAALGTARRPSATPPNVAPRVPPDVTPKVPPHAPKITSITLLGHDEPLRFTQRAEGLRISMPSAKPPTADLAIALRLTIA